MKQKRIINECMHSAFFILLILVFASILTACAPKAKILTEEEAGLKPIPEYSGPKAKVVVLSFKNRSAGSSWWGGMQMGSGMADMLQTALFRTNKFILLERQDIEKVLEEQDLSETGRFDISSLPQSGKLKGADLALLGTITGFKNFASGAGIGAGTIPVLGGIGGTKTWMSMDVKLVDIASGEIVSAGAVEGDSSFLLGGGLVFGLPLGAGLGGWKGTPKEKALRVCLEHAARIITLNVPKKYLKYAQ